MLSESMFSKGNVTPTHTHKNADVPCTLKVDALSFYNTFCFIYNLKINIIPECLELITIYSFSL